MPPDAYWQHINWTALGTLIGGVAAVASPFLLAWFNGRWKGAEVEIKARETATERLDRINREQFDRVSGERDYWRKRAQDAEAEVDQVNAQLDDAQRDGRAMGNWAHWYRHGWANVAQQWFRLAEQFEQLANGTPTPDRVRAVLAEINAGPPVDTPPPVPALRNAASQPVPLD